MIAPEKLSQYLAEIKAAPEAELVSSSKVLCLNHQSAGISLSDREQSHIQSFNITPHLSDDRQLIRLEYSFEQSNDQDGITTVSSISSVVTLRPGRVDWAYHSYGWVARRP
jgi:hypothetical protein